MTSRPLISNLVDLETKIRVEVRKYGFTSYAAPVSVVVLWP
jgi:hypothetical protein